MYERMAILAAFVLVYSLIAGRVDKRALSGPIIYVAFGIVMGPAGLGLLDFSADREGLRTLAEVTLALVLFTDAANADLGVLRKDLGLPARLLLVGLPLTILAGFGVGYYLFPGLAMLEVAILATMLAPTDAALGKAVVENEAVPADIRTALNVESGLNDGICVPILFVFLALAEHAGAQGSTTALALPLVAREIGIGLIVGLGVTMLGGLLLKTSNSRGWVSEVWSQLPVIALSFACFGLAQALDGSGFIAAFTGGLLFGRLFTKHKARFLRAAEGSGEALALFTWVVFGAAVVGQALDSFSLPVLGFAVLSLTAVRMLPVALSVIGLGMDAGTKLFLGWFGPRGLASIVFAIIVIDADLPGRETITAVVVWTITLSIVAHGITANPLSKAFANRMSRN